MMIMLQLFLRQQSHRPVSLSSPLQISSLLHNRLVSGYEFSVGPALKCRNMTLKAKTFLVRAIMRDAKQTAISAKLFYWMIFYVYEDVCVCQLSLRMKWRMFGKLLLHPSNNHTTLYRQATHRERQHRSSNKPNRWFCIKVLLTCRIYPVFIFY